MSRVANPLFHLGLTAAAATTNGAPLGRFYVEELIRLAELDSEQHCIVDLYEAVFLVIFLGAESPYLGGLWRGRAARIADHRLSSVAAQLG